MDCRTAQEMLVDLLYGELDRDDSDRLRAHLDKCSDCAEQYEQMNGILKLVRTHQPKEPPEEITERILHAAEAAAQHRAHQKKPVAFWKWLITNPALSGALAILLVATFAVFTMFPQNPQKKSAGKKPALQAVMPQAPSAKEMKKLESIQSKVTSTDTAKRAAPSKIPTASQKDEPTLGGLKTVVRKKTKGRSISDGPTMDRIATEKAGGRATNLHRGTGRTATRRISKKKRRHPSSRPAPRHVTSISSRLSREESSAGEAVVGPNATDETTHRDLTLKKPAVPKKTVVQAPESNEPADDLDINKSGGFETGSVRHEPEPEKELGVMPARQLPAAEEKNAKVQRQEESRPKAKATRRRVNIDGREASGTQQYLKAKSLFKSGYCKAAISAIDQAVRMFPNHRMAADALFDKASCLIKLGRFRQATDTYKHIERKYPQRAKEAKRQLQRINP